MEKLMLIETDAVEAVRYPCLREECSYVWRVQRGHVKPDRDAVVCPTCSARFRQASDGQALVDAQSADTAAYQFAAKLLGALPDKSLTLEVCAAEAKEHSPS